jgi:transposase
MGRRKRDRAMEPMATVKLTPRVRAVLVDAVRRGNYLEAAAALAGVSKQSVYTWLKEGERFPDSECGRFALEMEQAQAEFEDRMLGLIEGHAARDWTAAAWRLERKMPDKYGRRTVVSGDPNAPVRVVIERADDWRGGGVLPSDVIDTTAEVREG